MVNEDLDKVPVGVAAPPPISFSDALSFWLKLGFVSFGGPAGQIAIMHEELVERRRWISEGRFLHALNYCMLLPGPEAQQLATYIGWLMHRTWGGLLAGGLFVLPSMVILLALSWLYVAYGSTPWVYAFFFGVKPAVVAIVALAAYRIGSRVIRNAALAAIAAASFIAVLGFHVSFPWIVLAAGACTYLGARFAPSRFDIGTAHQKGKAANGRALIDDDTPPPAHARWAWPRAVSILGAAIIAWCAPLAALILVQGRSGTLPQMGWFFSKAALLTFGGAYAVLPYVYQGAVHFAWLTPAQMIDGLALGETTPGPLIIIVTFVGFVGSWTAAASQGLGTLVAGLLGGVCATYFTFLPSFMFIFFGAPLVEATRGNLKLGFMLTGITAAVVGVIVNLALFFAYQVFWSPATGGLFQWPAALLGLAAAVALFRFKVKIIPVILAAGICGMAMQLVLGSAAMRP